MFVLTDKPIISKQPKSLKEHPLNKTLFGGLLKQDYTELKEDIKKRGIQDPLHITKDDVIISGHQRRKIAIELGINCPCIIRSDLKEDWQIEEQLIRDNLLRRHLTDYQRVACAERLEDVEKQKAKQRLHIRTGGVTKENLPESIYKGQSRDRVAEKIGISGRQYSKAKKIYYEAPELIKKEWKDGKLSTHAAYQKTINKDGMSEQSRKIIFSSKSDDWKTPKKLYDELNQKYKFEFDPCPYQSTFDGLKTQWKENNFINPPYSNIDSFLEKAHHELEIGNAKTNVFLIPVRTDTKWFHTYIYPYFKNKINGIKADIEFIKGRVKFTNGSKTEQSAPFPSMIVTLRRDA